MDKIKQNLTYFICAFLGIWNFIMLAIPYVSIFVSLNGVSQTEGASGYKCMSLWDGGFSGVMSSLLQIAILIVGIILLAIGTVGILKTFNVIKKLPDNKTKGIAQGTLNTFAILNAVLLVFLIILTAVNTTSTNTGDYEMSVGIKLSAGIFIAVVLSVGTAIANAVLNKKFAVKEEPKTEEATIDDVIPQQ